MCHFNNHVGECLYLCTDHLGSVIGIINEHGEMRYEAKYDAWGVQECEINSISYVGCAEDTHIRKFSNTFGISLT